MKFKNIKKTKEKQDKPKAKKEEKKAHESIQSKIPQKKREFPNIYRIITERRFWLHIINVLALVGMLLVGIGLGKYIDQAEKIKQQRQGIENHVQYLQMLSQKYPGDRDIYIQLANDEYKLGNMKQASVYIEKALVLDPNYQPALKLKGYIITGGK